MILPVAQAAARDYVVCMNAERARQYLLSLPHVVETAQWGGIVFWVGDKAIGGKMLAMMNPDATIESPLFYPAGQERYAELLERDGIQPAPYMARIFWVAVEGWNVWRDPEWRDELLAAHQLTFDKLPPRTRAVLALSKAEQKKIVAERRKLMAAKQALKKSTSKRAG
jgi:predicted DNA-binding protein (MmcQ/YjbR family)